MRTIGIPVAIHSTDPEAFFTPLDNHNERYEELISNLRGASTDRSSLPRNRCLRKRNHIIEKHHERHLSRYTLPTGLRIWMPVSAG